MNDTERLVVLVDHLAEAIILLAEVAVGPSVLVDRIREHAYAAAHEAGVIAANAKDHR